MQSMPKSSLKYFWDVNPKSLDSLKNQSFIVERLLEQGDLESLTWINHMYPKNEIREIADHSRRLSPKTKNFCTLYYS